MCFFSFNEYSGCSKELKETIELQRNIIRDIENYTRDLMEKYSECKTLNDMKLRTTSNIKSKFENYMDRGLNPENLNDFEFDISDTSAKVTEALQIRKSTREKLETFEKNDILNKVLYSQIGNKDTVSNENKEILESTKKKMEANRDAYFKFEQEKSKTATQKEGMEKQMIEFEKKIKQFEQDILSHEEELKKLGNDLNTFMKKDQTYDLEQRDAERKELDSMMKKIRTDYINNLNSVNEEEKKLFNSLSNTVEGGIHYFFGLDCSGSMCGIYPKVYSCYNEIMNKLFQLSCEDRITINSFDDQLHNHCKNVSIKNKPTIPSSPAGGGTDFNVIFNPLEELTKRSSDTIVAWIFTDGHGSLDTSILRKIKENKTLFPDRDIILFCLGYGSGVNVSFLRETCKTVNGDYKFTYGAGDEVELFIPMNSEGDIIKAFNTVFSSIKKQKSLLEKKLEMKKQEKLRLKENSEINESTLKETANILKDFNEKNSSEVKKIKAQIIEEKEKMIKLEQAKIENLEKNLLQVKKDFETTELEIKNKEIVIERLITDIEINNSEHQQLQERIEDVNNAIKNKKDTLNENNSLFINELKNQYGIVISDHRIGQLIEGYRNFKEHFEKVLNYHYNEINHYFANQVDCLSVFKKSLKDIKEESKMHNNASNVLTLFVNYYRQREEFKNPGATISEFFTEIIERKFGERFGKEVLSTVLDSLSSESIVGLAFSEENKKKFLKSMDQDITDLNDEIDEIIKKKSDNVKRIKEVSKNFKTIESDQIDSKKQRELELLSRLEEEEKKVLESLSDLSDVETKKEQFKLDLQEKEIELLEILSKEYEEYLMPPSCQQGETPTPVDKKLAVQKQKEFLTKKTEIKNNIKKELTAGLKNFEKEFKKNNEKELKDIEKKRNNSEKYILSLEQEKEDLKEKLIAKIEKENELFEDEKAALKDKFKIKNKLRTKVEVLVDEIITVMKMFQKELSNQLIQKTLNNPIALVGTEVLYGSKRYQEIYNEINSASQLDQK